MLKMEVLRNAFEKMGFRDVKTVIASGNVIFETDKTPEKILEEKIEKELPKYIGFQSSTIVRTIDDLEKLFNKNLFENVKTGPDLRPHVTFMKNEVNKSIHSTDLKGTKIIDVVDGAICYVIDLSGKTPDVMGALEKQFGKTITTRNWKTVERILKSTLSN